MMDSIGMILMIKMMLTNASPIQISGLLPEKKLSKKETFDAQTISERKISLSKLLDALVAQRDLIFSDSLRSFHFAKFIAPIQIGDQRPPNFVMPFKLELS
jgi:hypothetical protein